MRPVHYERPCTGRHCAECTDDNVTAWDLLGIAPDFTDELSVDEYMDEQRGRGGE